MSTVQSYHRVGLFRVLTPHSAKVDPVLGLFGLSVRSTEAVQKKNPYKLDLPERSNRVPEPKNVNQPQKNPNKDVSGGYFRRAGGRPLSRLLWHFCRAL